MASSDIDYESSSDETIPEPTEFFRSADLPIISNQSPYDSDDSSSTDSEEPESPSFPSTPTTPASPATSLEAAFPFVGLSSQTSDDQLISTPKPKRKRRLVKRKTFPLKKGVPPFVLRGSKDLAETQSKSVGQLRPCTKIFILKWTQKL